MVFHKSASSIKNCFINSTVAFLLLWLVTGCAPSEKIAAEIIPDDPPPNTIIDTSVYIQYDPNLSTPAKLTNLDTIVKTDALYTLGHLYNQATETRDYILSKIDLNGSLVWTRNFLKTANTYNNMYMQPSLTFDASDNIYVLGTDVIDATTDVDWFFAKYTPLGTLVWEHRFSSAKAAASSLDFPLAMVVFGNGQFNIVGKYNVAEELLSEPFGVGMGIRASDMIIANFDNTGTLQWQTATLASNVERRLLASVSFGAGNTYVGFTDFALPSEDPATLTGITNDAFVQYDALGNLVWEFQIPNPTLSDQLGAIFLPTRQFTDKMGNLYIIKYEVSNLRALFQKWSVAGTQLWSVVLPSLPKATIINDAGEALMSTVDDSLLKYDTLGNLVLEKLIPDLGVVGVNDMLIDEQGRIILGAEVTRCITQACTDRLQYKSNWSEIIILDPAFVEIGKIQMSGATIGKIQVDATGNIYHGTNPVSKYSPTTIIPSAP